MPYRILSLILALLLTLSSLVACGTELPNGDGFGEQPPVGDEPTDPDDPASDGPAQPDRPAEPSTGDGCAHADADGDEVCDDCQESVVVLIDLYAINDLHGKFCDTAKQPGLDELATYLRLSDERDDHAVFLSSGDMWQGSGESNLSSGAIIVEWMNELGFVSMTLGNHEYDWGEQAIRDNAAIAAFPFLGINVYDVSTGERVDYCESSVMIERGGIQIGIIGAMGDCYSSISSDKVENVRFITGAQLTALVTDEAQRLREAGADLIVYSVHDGYDSSSSGTVDVFFPQISDYYGSALSDGVVDLVFEGHSHQRYTLVDAGGVYHLQGGGENSGISHAEVKVNLITGKVGVTAAGVVSSTAYGSLEDDAATEALEQRYADVIDRAYNSLGRVDRTVSSSELCELVAQYYLDAALEYWGDEYDIVLGGGYLKTRSPYDLSRGAKTYADVLSLFPFDNPLVLCSVKGDKLRSRFINTGSDYHTALSEYGERIKSSISSSKTYYIVVDTYTALYKPNGLTVVAEYESGVFARDLLADAIRRGDFTTDHTDAALTSIGEVLAIGRALDKGQQTAASYYVKGTVTRIENTTYGNLYIEDGNGNELYVYGVYDTDGNRFDSPAFAGGERPTVGSEIVLYAPIQRYVNNSTGQDIVELKGATLIQ